MRYKGLHFYTLHQHLTYMKEVEQLDDIEIAHQLREYWNCGNIEIAYYLDQYDKEENNEAL